MWTTVNLLRERRMFLLAPIYAGNGLIGAFLSANVSTVSCCQRRKPHICACKSQNRCRCVVDSLRRT